MADPRGTSPDAADLQGGHNDALGLRFDSLSEDRVTVSLQIGPHHLQPHGITHGGVWCALVETAASVAAGLWYGERGRVVGVSNHTDFLHAVEGGTVTATASPIHRGRLQQLWLVEIHDERDRLVARGQLRAQNLPAQ